MLYPKTRRYGAVLLVAAALSALAAMAGAAPPGISGQKISISSTVSQSCGGVPCIWADSALGKIKLRDAAGIDKLVGEADRVTSASSDPVSPVPGQCIYNTSSNKIRCYQNSSWVNWGDGGAAASVGFSAVQAALAAATGSVAFNAQKLTGVATPTASTDAANKAYVDAAAPEIFWTRTCTITSAAAATPVTCLSDGAVGSKTAFVMGWRGKVNGATAWATTATCAIKDSSGLAVPFVTVPVAAMTGNAFVSDNSAGVTQSAAYSLNQGGSATRGLVLVCDANGTGSDLVVTVFGAIK